MGVQLRSVPAGAGLVAATPVAAWWVVGDQSSRGFDDLDYIFRPVDVPLWVEMLAGAGAVAVVMLSVFALAEARRDGHLDRTQVRTLVQLCVAGVIIGAGWRAVTAGVIGANIGGAIVLLLALPLATGLVGAAVIGVFVEGRRSASLYVSGRDLAEDRRIHAPEAHNQSLRSCISHAWSRACQATRRAV